MSVRSVVFILFQRYEFESKSQQKRPSGLSITRCLSYFKDTNLKANHNYQGVGFNFDLVFILFQRYEFESKSQLMMGATLNIQGVYPISKIRIWKQITTISLPYILRKKVFILFQRYEFESKSQLLTIQFAFLPWCLSYFKDTNLKANHNKTRMVIMFLKGVYPISKIRIWKQITTATNWCINWSQVFILFQRYEFESKSQLLILSFSMQWRCLSYFKDTNLKANHNRFVNNH